MYVAGLSCELRRHSSDRWHWIFGGSVLWLCIYILCLFFMHWFWTDMQISCDSCNYLNYYYFCIYLVTFRLSVGLFPVIWSVWSVLDVIANFLKSILSFCSNSIKTDGVFTHIVLSYCVYFFYCFDTRCCFDKFVLYLWLLFTCLYFNVLFVYLLVHVSLSAC